MQQTLFNNKSFRRNKSKSETQQNPSEDLTQTSSQKDIPQVIN